MIFFDVFYVDVLIGYLVYHRKSTAFFDICKKMQNISLKFALLSSIQQLSAYGSRRV